jgi:mannose-1-phosphate guanylyltransferase/mannose-6-phosphate isomerase
LARLPHSDGFAPPIILCNGDHRFLVRQELVRTGIAAQKIFLEPVSRNTAPAMAVAALAVAKHDRNGVLVATPSDHAIGSDSKFVEAVRRAAGVAAEGRLVLFGIEAVEPRTEYGYIRKGLALEGSAGGAFHVDGFFEKPDLETAKRYVATGNYYWNSGIFTLHAQTFLDEFERLNPDILEAAREALDKAQDDGEFVLLDAAAFAQSPNISVDYAVMEKTGKAAMLPLDVGWSDVGSWKALWELAPRDSHDNFVQGDVVLEDSKGLYVDARRSLVAAVGVQDLVIVETADALLVLNKGRSQDVSKVVAKLRSASRKEQEFHPRSTEAWGYAETLSIGPGFRVDFLCVSAGARLSRPGHNDQSRSWTVVRGTALALVDGAECMLSEGKSLQIPAATPHGLENRQNASLEIIETRTGPGADGDGAAS